MQQIQLSQGQFALVDDEGFPPPSESRRCYRAAAPAAPRPRANIIYRIKNLRPAPKEYRS
jgi:hypothetical protein